VKCPVCFNPESKIIETRPQENNLVKRRHECTDCGHRFSTYELPPAAYNFVRYDIKRWSDRQVGEWNTKIRQRAKMARRMCELKLAGATAAQLAEQFGLSVHMAHYYTSPKAMKKFGVTK
jgi:hypothetical protein